MLTVTRFDWDLMPRLRLDDAGPRERITLELIDEVRRGSPWAELSGPPFDLPDGRQVPGVLTLRDDFGHRYIYRIVDFDVLTLTFGLEWPD